MNRITKKSFYSFLALYLISSFLFLSLAAYWFYTSQVAMEKNANFYKMNHIADIVSAKVIEAHMKHTKFKLDAFQQEAIALFDANKHLLYGRTIQDVDFSKDFYMKDDVFTLVTQRTAGHLNVQYIVVQSSECIKNIEVIKNKIAYAVIITAFLIILIAVFLSYIFLKPLKDKMQEIEDFVKDTTHELNTPITAIMMSTSRLKAKKVYDEKTVKNISISTKQLYDIYASLSFLSFDNNSEEAVALMFNEIVKEDIDYFSELLEKKKIQLQIQLESCPVKMAPTKAKMLINNLLSNAIKYSNPRAKIKITTTKNSLIIQDEGIGIKKEKLSKIFNRFVRANSYAGGFGVGLNIVESIIKEYNFHIDIQSKENFGTTVTIVFVHQL
jgi:two-component system OmpR family sensor kinase